MNIKNINALKSGKSFLLGGGEPQRLRRRTGVYETSLYSLRHEQHTASFGWKPGRKVAATTSSTRPR